MKSLNKCITEGLRIGINKCIPIMSESLRIGINDSPYVVSPTTFKELRQIVEERYEEQGPGTKTNPIDFNDIDVSKLDTFTDDYIGVFSNTKFEYIDISDWNTSNIKYMNNMFWGCIHLKSIGDISNWDVLNVENVHGMFYGCVDLKSVGDISNWDISNVKNKDWMFRNSGIINTPDWYYKK